MTQQQVLMAVPSNIPVIQANIARDIALTTGTLTKTKEIVIKYPGTYRTKISMSQSGAASASSNQAQVYRNGTAVGVLHTTRAGVNEFVASTYVEDIGGWVSGDLCQLYVSATNVASTIPRTLGFGIFAEYAYQPPLIPAGEINVDINV